MAKKKRGKGSSSNRMTSAERTRAKMRAQEQAQAERREVAAKAEGKASAEVSRATPANDTSAQVEDIDAQIAALQRRKAQLEGSSKGEAPAEDLTKVVPEDKGHAKPPKASKSDETTSERRRPQAYPGEDKLRRAQGRLEQQAAKWDANPTVNRVVCALIDFFVGGVCIVGPAYLPYYYLSGSNSVMDLAGYVELGYPASLPIALGCVGLVLGIVYYVVVPWKVWPGQTLGKHLGHIRIVRRDRRDLDLGTLLLRQVVGVLFLELGLTCNLLLVPQLIALVTGSSDAGTSFQAVGIAITVVSVILFFISKNRLPLHDRFAGTRVVQI